MTNEEEAYGLRNKLSDLELELNITQSYMEHIQEDSEHWWKLLNQRINELDKICRDAREHCQKMVRKTESPPPNGLPLSQLQREPKQQTPAIIKVDIKGA